MITLFYLVIHFLLSGRETNQLWCFICKCGLQFMCITLYGAPLCFPSQNPLSVHLVLLVAAHHSKRGHLLLSAHMQT